MMPSTTTRTSKLHESDVLEWVGYHISACVTAVAFHPRRMTASSLVESVTSCCHGFLEENLEVSQLRPGKLKSS